MFDPSPKDLAKVLHYYGMFSGEDEYKVVCPFHEDLRPSMIIKISGNFFHCFGCQASGNAFDFVRMANPKLDELECLKRYFRILRSKKVRNISPELVAKAKRLDENLQDIAYDYYHGLKTVDWRDVDDPIKDYMKKRGFRPQTLNKCKAKLTYIDRNYPIVFPMFDMGEFRGWVSRTNSKHVEERRKYLYNTGFSRRDTIVGDYDNEVVVIVEGYMDRLKLIQFGLKKVGALLGWKATQQQIDKLKAKGVKTIISALDADKCGRKGTAYLSKYFEVIPFPFPEGVKDPGDLTFDQFEVANKKAKAMYRRMKHVKRDTKKLGR